MNPDELSVSNSIFLESREYRGTVWAIVQARFTSPSQAIGGFCATAWLLEATPDHRLIFVTARHAIPDEIFIPRVSNMFTKVWLSDGKISIPIELSNRTLGQNDIAFLIVPTKVVPHWDSLKPIKLDLVSNPADRTVYNLGFPDRGNKDYSIHLFENGATFDNGPWIQSGRSLNAGTCHVSAVDVKINGGGCILLDYTSEKGFSGGPLFLRGSNLAIGLMSMVVPNGNLVPTQAVAVDAREIAAQRRELIK